MINHPLTSTHPSERGDLVTHGKLSKRKRRFGKNAKWFTLLMHLISRIINEKSENAVNLFEEYCRLVKQDIYLHPDYKLRIVTGAEQIRHIDFARSFLNNIKTMDDCSATIKSSSAHPTIAKLALTWSHFGFALPPFVDYFVDHQLHQFRQEGKFKQVRFWGIIHTLDSNYYVIELERDNIEAVQLEYEMAKEQSHIAKDVIDDLIRAVVSEDSIVTDWCGAESMVADILEEILEYAIPADTDIDLAMSVTIPVLENVIEEAIDVAQEPEVELSVMGSLDVVSCNATVESSDLSLNQVKFASFKKLVEVKLNVFRYLVSLDPLGGDWVDLPETDLEKIIASSDVTSYFRGKLDSPVVEGKKKIVSEKDYLRAVLARISMDQFARPKNAEDRESEIPSLISEKDVKVYYKATGFPCDWSEKKLNRRHPTSQFIFKKSNIWPGSFTFDAEHIYFGWGVQNVQRCRHRLLTSCKC
ncbi:uncharacterized protein LOC129762718 isoform X2 [Toxorhynchites rutilus septentrionalis]|uniref:uncharacterized protein LOC129762718 isoform X2 n=1 Tax=Toxorhynchites rutilus septentrionalis TaxID=329112 RepID=UPI0024787D30|nr:uncharacterized protein LOC129762718 isoform X2 [Toxorhynchites rutilus septentrionalis]